MAGDKKISQLTAATSVGITDVLPIVQSSQTKKITWNNAMLSITKVGTVTTGVWNGTAIAIAYGGTNSTAALSNDRLMVSSGGAIVEHFANTQDNVAYYNASGLPTGSTIFQFNGTNLAIGLSVSSATSKLHVKGTTGTGTNKVFLAESTTVSDAFYITESGIVNSKTAYYLGGSKFVHFGGNQYGITGTSTYIGHQSGGNETGVGESNSGIGANALFTLTTGKYNVAIGRNAGYALTTGQHNMFLGFEAGNTITSGYYNTLVGASIASTGSLTTGQYNFAIGYNITYSANTTDTLAWGYNHTVASNRTAHLGTATGIQEWFFGQGEFANAASVNYVRIQPTSALTSVGSNQDSSGNILYIAGSRSSGDKEGSPIVFQTSPAGASGSALNSLVERLRITADGRIYGTALHNNTGSLTGTTNQYIASGGDTITPTATEISNCSVSAPTEWKFIRAGNDVVASCRVTIDPTLTVTSTSFRISLPIASDFATADDCSGFAFCGAIAGQGAEVTADTTNNEALVTFLSGDITSQTWSLSIQYTIK